MCNIHRSRIFWFCAITTGTLISVISWIVPFYPLYITLHVLSYFSTSSSRQFQQACSHLRVNELEHGIAIVMPRDIPIDNGECFLAVHMYYIWGSTLWPLPHVPTGKALWAISHKHIIILRSPLPCHNFKNLSNRLSLMPSWQYPIFLYYNIFVFLF